ncbi:MAG: ferritin family protein [Candidatus Ozemobacteraceae bacterium]
MNKEMSLSEVLAMAITREQEAFFFYTDLMDLATDKNVKDTLQWIANEEMKHRKFLLDYKSGKHAKNALQMSTVIDYKVAEHISEPDSGKPLTSGDIFLVAAHREAKSTKFYTSLSELHSDPEIKGLFLKMANEELKHKEKMEYLYSNTEFAQTAGG